MSATDTHIDPDEYLHLALEAVRRDDHGAALAYLKEGAQRAPQDPRIAYLLGAEHAQIGLYDRAEAEMQRAIELDPQMHTARFQLGLLQMTQGRAGDADSTWQGLDALLEGHAMRCFRDGLKALAADRFAEARQIIQAGLAANDFSPELNRDMENLLQRIPEVQSAPDVVSPDATGHVWLNAYQNNDQRD